METFLETCKFIIRNEWIGALSIIAVLYLLGVVIVQFFKNRKRDKSTGAGGRGKISGIAC